jgi:hypothetical protein
MSQIIEIQEEDLKKVKELNFNQDSYAESNELGFNSFEEFIENKEKLSGFEVEKSSLSQLSPLERSFAAQGINLQDASVTLESFYASPKASSLVPAWISKKIYEGLNLGKMSLRLSDLIATSEKIKGVAVKSIGIDQTKTRSKSSRISEGATFPKTTIGTKERSIELVKVGHQMDFTYEAQRRVNINILAVALRRVGFQLGKQIVQQGLKVLVDGDGNTNSASPESVPAATNWKYTDLIDLLYNSFEEGHEPSHVVLNRQMFIKVLTDETNFAPFQSRGLLEAFIEKGQLPEYFGNKWLIHPSVPDNAIIAYEKSSCLAYYEESSSSIVEVDKVISKQLNETTASINFNFSKLFSAASHIKTKA